MQVQQQRCVIVASNLTGVCSSVVVVELNGTVNDGDYAAKARLSSLMVPVCQGIEETARM